MIRRVTNQVFDKSIERVNVQLNITYKRQQSQTVTTAIPLAFWSW
jgi:uncharacterized protein YqgV (UPF0045/DUF77 family)